MSESVVESEVVLIAASTKLLIQEITAKWKVHCQISDRTILELAKYFLRDINRIREQQTEQIGEQQTEKVSSIKFAGYWGFWIRKLKPISTAFKIGDDEKDPRNEIFAINEFVALEISIAFVLQISGFTKHDVIIDLVRGTCSLRREGKCNGASCVRQAAFDFLNFHGEVNLRYIIYSMRHRTFGPHHFVTNLDHIVFGACKRSGGI